MYQILSDSAGLRYVGATSTSLEERLLRHKLHKKQYERGTYHRVTSFDVLNHPDARIELLEECDSKEHLHERERHYIKQLDCVNRCIPGRDHREYHQDNKEAIHARKRRKVQCYICDKYFSSSNLASHIRNIHTDSVVD